jgi:hypothetical protein
MNPDLTRLMDNARVRLPGAVDTAIKLELFAVFNDFFQNTNIWREEVPVVVAPPVTDYEVTPFSVSTINRLMWVYDDKGFPVSAIMPVPGSLKLAYEPDATKTITVTVALTVTDPVTREDFPEFPDWVLNKYNTCILDGLLARMMSQAAKPYSNAQLAAFHGKEYMQGCSFAKVETQRNNVYRSQSWRFPQTFNRRRYVRL